MEYQTIKQQIVFLIRLYGSTAANGSRRISPETTQIRCAILFLIVAQLKEGGFPICNLKNIRQKHLFYLARRWEQDNLASGTMQNRWSLLKTALEKWLGRQGLVKKLSTYLVNPNNARRAYAAQCDKSWSAKVNVDAQINAVAEKDVNIANQLRLMLAFGLRRKEAIMFQPKVNDHGNFISVTNGTKGGRHRIIDVTNAAQRELLDRLKAQTTSRLGYLGHPNKTLKQNIARFDYVLRALNITHHGLGITSHGLRHQFANDLIEGLTGEPTPVRSGSQPIDTEKFEAARQIATESLGHSRVNITTAYHGAVRKP